MKRTFREGKGWFHSYCGCSPRLILVRWWGSHGAKLRADVIQVWFAIVRRSFLIGMSAVVGFHVRFHMLRFRDSAEQRIV